MAIPGALGPLAPAGAAPVAAPAPAAHPAPPAAPLLAAAGHAAAVAGPALGPAGKVTSSSVSSPPLKDRAALEKEDNSRRLQNAKIKSVASTFGLIAGVALMFASIFFPPLMLVGLPLMIASTVIAYQSATEGSKAREKMGQTQRREALMNKPAEQKMDEKTDQIMDLNKKIDRGEKKLKELPNKKQEIDDNIKYLKSLHPKDKKDEDEIGKKLIQLKQQKLNLEKQESILQDNLQRHRAQVHKKTQEFNDVKKGKLDELNQKAATKQDELDQIPDKKIELSNRLPIIDERCKEIEAAPQPLTQALAQEMENLKNEKASIEVEIPELDQKLVDLPVQIKQLKDQIGDLEKMQAGVKPPKAAISAPLTPAEAKKKALEDEIQNKKTLLGDLTKQRKFGKEYNELQAEIRELQSQLKRL